MLRKDRISSYGFYAELTLPLLPASFIIWQQCVTVRNSKHSRKKTNEKKTKTNKQINEQQINNQTRNTDLFGTDFFGGALSSPERIRKNYIILHHIFFLANSISGYSDKERMFLILWTYKCNLHHFFVFYSWSSWNSLFQHLLNYLLRIKSWFQFLTFMSTEMTRKRRVGN